MDDESTCDDDPQELARKGYIHQSRQKKSKGYAQSTLERIKQVSYFRQTCIFPFTSIHSSLGDSQLKRNSFIIILRTACF